MEDLVSLPTLEEDGTFKAPKIEDMSCTLKTLQQEMKLQNMMNGGYMRNDYMSSGENILDKELIELNFTRNCLQKEMSTLEIQLYQLEELHKQKEDLLKKLEFQCEESGQDCAKQMKQSKFHCDALEQYKCEIQELRLKLQKQRVKLENQLLDLMEQHKLLESMFTLKSLPDEIKRAESTNIQLLSVEQAKIALLCQLNEELEQVKKQMQLETTADAGEE